MGSLSYWGFELPGVNCINFCHVSLSALCAAVVTGILRWLFGISESVCWSHNQGGGFNKVFR